MKKKIYLAMLAVCFALTASACGNGGAVITDGTKTEGAADGKKAETGTTRLVSVENVEKYITIGEYKGLTLDNTVDAITDDDVQAQIDENLKDKAEPVSDAAKEGDLVTVNYTGTKDGQTFDGGTANNYDFVIGDGQMFEEFENGVIGMKKGDTKEIKIDFPSDYADETLAGKEVITSCWQSRSCHFYTSQFLRSGSRFHLPVAYRHDGLLPVIHNQWSL